MSQEDQKITTFKKYVEALRESDPTALRQKLAALLTDDFEAILVHPDTAPPGHSSNDAVRRQ